LLIETQRQKVKDSNWEIKYMPVLVDFYHKTIDVQRKCKKDADGKKIPCSP